MNVGRQDVHDWEKSYRAEGGSSMQSENIQSGWNLDSEVDGAMGISALGEGSRLFSDPDALATQIIRTIGPNIVLALPLGLGEANHIANALLERRRSDSGWWARLLRLMVRRALSSAPAADLPLFARLGLVNPRTLRDRCYRAMVNGAHQLPPVAVR